MLNFKALPVNISLIFLMIFFISCQNESKKANNLTFEETRVEIESNGWQLIGDLLMPSVKDSLSVVLLLNKATGNRQVYKDLAHQLAKKEIASLRLDLRGHGESVNLGEFIPRKLPHDPIIWDAEQDIIAVCNYLRSHPRINKTKIGIVGSSYSGEEMADAGRKSGFVQAYVALSPGSFSEQSIHGIDSSNVPWLFITSNNERFLKDITKSVQEQSKTVELIIIPGERHASDLLMDNHNLSARIAVWFSYILK